ncbi:MAG TPA: hypothetical protein V6D17_04475 [Candidatus Obscuribacterales bacterium]
MARFRRRRGATLGMSALIALVVIMLGVAFFFMIKLFGGAREIANATDAGTLNVAKRALKDYGIDVPPEFAACAVPEGGKITLLTYNRLVGQAILVAMNAQNDPTKQSLANAKRVWNDVEKIGVKFANAFDDTNEMGGYFDEIANANNRKMFGNATITPQKISTAFLRPGYSSNLYFDPGSLPDPKLATSLPYSKGTLTAKGGQKYLAGYTPLELAGISIYAVPVFPQQSPHLIAIPEFEQSKNPPSPSSPPNAFRVDAISKDKNDALKSLAAAVVGAVNSNFMKSEFAAAIPGGYIEIVNLPGKRVPSNWKTSYDSTMSIFNREIYYGLQASSSGAFSDVPGEVPAWAAYNNSVGSDANGHDPSLYPPNLGFNQGTLRFGRGKDQLATPAEALAIKDSYDCDPSAYDYTKAGVCSDLFVYLLQNFGRQPAFGAPQDRPPFGYTNVEYAKGQVLDAFSNQDNWFVDIEIEKMSPSGLKVFDRDNIYPNPDYYLDDSGNLVATFEYDISFGRVGTITELIKHSADCSDKILKGIYTRCKQIRPGTTDKEVDTLLATLLPMGKEDKPHTMYIYLDQKNDKLTISDQKPKTFTDMVPDGRHPFDKDATGYEPFDWRHCENCMQKCYRTDGTLVNTAAGSKKLWNAKKKQWEYYSIPGDGKSVQQLYLKIEAPRGTVYTDGLWAYDRACWRTSSGAGNLLGRLEFSQYFIGKNKENPDKVYTLTNPN